MPRLCFAYSIIERKRGMRGKEKLMKGIFHPEFYGEWYSAQPCIAWQWGYAWV